jgi:hypothetical protein
MNGAKGMLPKAYVDAIRIDKNLAICIDDLAQHPSLKDGLYFEIAKWSGESQLAWRKLHNILEGVVLPSGFAIYVVDTDGPVADRVFDFPEARRAGKGELLVVQDGKTVRQIEPEGLLEEIRNERRQDPRVTSKQGT